MDMYSLTTETGALLVAGGLNPLYIEDVIENTILEDLDGGIDGDDTQTAHDLGVVGDFLRTEQNAGAEKLQVVVELQ